MSTMPAVTTIANGSSRLMNLLLLLLAVYMATPVCGNMQLLGLGGGGGNGMVKGSSFNLDTKERITRVHGAGIKLDLELLELAAAGGSMLYTPTHVEFKKGLTRWMQTFSDGKISLHHNDKTVLQLYTPDESPYYLLSMRGNAAFRDLILDKSLSNAVAFTLCIVDSVFDKSLSQASCEVRAESMHLTVSQSMEGLAKSLLFVSEFVSSAQLNLLSETVEAVQTSLVAPLKGQVVGALAEVRGEVSGLQKGLRAEREALDARLHASEASVNSTLSALLGEVAKATTVTLAAISSESHSNLTKLEKSVFLHFVEFNKTYGRLLDVTVLQLQTNLTVLQADVETRLRGLTEDGLPALHAAVTAETLELVQTSLASFGAESSANASALFATAMNATRLLWSNVTQEHLALQQQDVRLLELHAIHNASLASAGDQIEALRQALSEAEVTNAASMTAMQSNMSTVRAAVVSLAANHSSQLQHHNESLVLLAENITTGLSEVRVEGAVQAAEVEAALAQAVVNMEEQLAGNVSTLQNALNVTRQHLHESEQNLTRSLAKSNSVLAKAVGDVNQSLTMLGTAAGESFARLESNLSQNLGQVRAEMNSTAENVTSQARLELEEAESRLSLLVEGTAGNFSQRLGQLDARVVERLVGLGTALREEAGRQEVRQLQALEDAVVQGEANLTRSIEGLNVSFTDNLDSFQKNVSESFLQLNTSTEGKVADLSVNMTSLFLSLQQLVVDLAREVYSPLEVDEAHPDSQVPPPPVVPATPEDDRFQRIDRLKKSKAAKAVPVPPPRPVHFLHEELRVEVQGSMLALLEHEHGGSLSRSAVIEKGLHKLQQALRSQGEALEEQLKASGANQTDALQRALELGGSNLEAATTAVTSELRGLNASLMNVSSTAEQKRNQLHALFLEMNATLSTALLQQALMHNTSVRSVQQELVSSVTGLNATLTALRKETHANSTENLAMLWVGINRTAQSVVELEARARQELVGVSAALSAALVTESAALNSSALQLEAGLRIEIQELADVLKSNSSSLAGRVVALNESWWVEQVASQRLGETRAAETAAALVQLGQNMSAAEQRQQSEAQGMHAMVAANVTELRHMIVASARVNNASSEALGGAVASLSKQHAALVAEQAGLWTASATKQDEAAIAAAQELHSLNESLTTQVASSTAALTAALEMASASHTNAAALNHAEALQLIESSSMKTATSLSAAAELTDSRFKGVDAALAALTTASNEESTRIETSLTRLIKDSTAEVAAQSSAALAASSTSLQATVEASQSRLTGDMATLSSDVKVSLKTSLEANTQQLERFTALVGGQINLTDHRVTQVEARLGASEVLAESVQRAQLVASVEEAHTRADVTRLAAAQEEQGVRIWGVLNASALSSAALSHLAATSATTSEQLSLLDNNMRNLAGNCSQQAGLLQGSLLQASEWRASNERMHSSTDARLLALDEQVSKGQAAVGALQTQLGGAETSVPALQLDLSRVSGRVEQVFDSVRGLEGKVEVAEEAAKQALAEVASMGIRLTEVTGSGLPALTAALAEVKSGSEKGLEKLAAQQQNTVDKTLAASDEKVAKMEQRMAIVELLVAQQGARIEALSKENEALKRTTAAQESVDDLRRLLQELQASMLSQSSKVLDLIVANLAAGRGQ